MDPEKRLALYHEATVLANEEALMVWLVNLPNIWGASERLLWEPRVDAKLDVQSMSFK